MNKKDESQLQQLDKAEREIVEINEELARIKLKYEELNDRLIKLYYKKGQLEGELIERSIIKEG